MNMKRTNIYLTQPQSKALAKVAKRMGIPTAELIRRILDEWLVKQQSK